jgi:hypothetical protein
MITLKHLYAMALAAGFVLAAVAADAQTPPAPAPPGSQQPYLDALNQSLARVRANQVVTNAPYSADVTSTVTQALADGTRIEQSTTGKVFRDVAGRMRREQQVLGLATLTPGTNPVSVITITDPATRTTYTINDQARTATIQPYSQVLQWNGNQWNTAISFGRAIAYGIGDLTQELVALRVRDRVSGVDLHGLTTTLPVETLRADRLPELAQGGGRGARTGGPVSAPAMTAAPESLGSRQIEGVPANGTRRTQTIPTGQIGNDRPIVITDEIWESPELQITVYSKHHDPRSGDVEYRLRNISRNEPPAALFQVPAGYTVIDPLNAPGRNGAGARGGRGGAPLPGTRAPGQ